MMVRVFLLIIAVFSFTNIWSQNSVITGRVANPTFYFQNGSQVNSEVKLTYYNLLGLYEEVVAPVRSDGSFKASVPLKVPSTVNFNYDAENLSIFLNPKEVVNLSFNAVDFENSLEFSGPGASNNKYFADFEKYRESDLYYITDAAQLKEKKLDFLSAYTRNNSVSSSFEDWAKAEIEYGAANEELVNSYSPNERAAVFSKYDLSNSTAINSIQYMNYVDQYITNIFNTMNPYGSEDRWVNYFQYTSNNLSGRTRDLYLTKVVNRMLEAKIPELGKYVAQFYKLCATKEYKAVIASQYSDIREYYSADVPAGANLYDLTGDTDGLHQILKKYSGKLVYIDFWASWCKPCLEEMQKSGSLKSRYANKDVAFIYISLDKGQDSWRGAIANNKLRGEHFLANKYVKSDAAQLFDIFGIPHYILIDKYGSIVDANAKKPSDPTLPSDLDFYLTY